MSRTCISYDGVIGYRRCPSRARKSITCLGDQSATRLQLDRARPVAITHSDRVRLDKNLWVAAEGVPARPPGSAGLADCVNSPLGYVTQEVEGREREHEGDSREAARSHQVIGQIRNPEHENQVPEVKRSVDRGMRLAIFLHPQSQQNWKGHWPGHENRTCWFRVMPKEHAIV